MPSLYVGYLAMRECHPFDQVRFIDWSTKDFKCGERDFASSVWDGSAFMKMMTSPGRMIRAEYYR